MRPYILVAALVVAALVSTLAMTKKEETQVGTSSDERSPAEVSSSDSETTSSPTVVPALQEAEGLKRLPFEPPTPEYTKPHQALVFLTEGGDPIPITVRRPQIVNPPYEISGRLVDQYDDLAAAARSGDAPAARMLFQELLTCSRLAAMQDKERRSHSHTNAEEHSHGLDDDLARCEGITQDHLENFNDWARIAAENGDYLGRQYWGGALGKTKEAVAVFKAFWDDGNASALPALSSLHASGVATGEPDWVRSYAFNLIYLKLHEAARATGESWKPSGHRIDSYIALSDHLRNIGGMLTPGQQKQAEELAFELLSQNENCCMGNF